MAEVVSTNQFKTGMAIEIEGQPFTIVDFQHVKPGKGGAFVRTKVRNIATGAVLDKTFRAGEKFERMHTQSRKMAYLYSTEDEVVLMDNDSYEQVSVSPAMAVEWRNVTSRPRRRASCICHARKNSNVEGIKSA